MLLLDYVLGLLTDMWQQQDPNSPPPSKEELLQNLQSLVLLQYPDLFVYLNAKLRNVKVCAVMEAPGHCRTAWFASL